MNKPSPQKDPPLSPPLGGEDPGAPAYQNADVGSCIEDRRSPSNSHNAVLPPKGGRQRGGSPEARSTHFALDRRQALIGASAAALMIGMAPPDASAAALSASTTDPIDMTGHVPAYNAPIGFGRPKASATPIDDPYDLIFA